MDSLKNVLEMEKQIKEMVQHIKNEIVGETENTPIDGVKPLSKNMAVVSFSNLKNNIWTPEYYIPSAQAKYIEQALEHITTASAFVSKMEEIILNKKVKIGSNTYPINDTTIGVLKKYLNGMEKN